MSKAVITESNLSDIADAIRAKLGVETTYKPGQMAAAIQSIPSGSATLITKTITSNGTYDSTDDSADGYSEVTVNVPNSYTSGDEGKVVSNGALVAQTSRNIAENGTYDTTTNDEVVVNVSGGGSSAIILADNAYATTGSYTYDKTVTVPESGTYKIAVQAYTSDLTVKINNVPQTLAIDVSSDYTRLYSATVSLSAGDVIDIYATSSGRSTVTAFIIKE